MTVIMFYHGHAIESRRDEKVDPGVFEPTGVFHQEVTGLDRAAACYSKKFGTACLP